MMKSKMAMCMVWGN